MHRRGRAEYEFVKANRTWPIQEGITERESGGWAMIKGV